MVEKMDCGMVASKFELQSRYYVHFRTNTLGKGMNPLILPVMSGFSTELIDMLSVKNRWVRFSSSVFLDQSCLHFSHLFVYMYFLLASTRFKSQSLIDGGEFFKTEFTYALMAWDFTIWYFFHCLSNSRCIFASRPSSCLCNYFFILIIPSVIVIFFLFPYLKSIFSFLLHVCWYFLVHSPITCW